MARRSDCVRAMFAFIDSGFVESGFLFEHERTHVNCLEIATYVHIVTTGITKI